MTTNHPSNTDPASAPLVITQRTPGGLGLITLNRPKALNALSLQMIRLLTDALRGWQHDAGIHAVAIRGMGKAGEGFAPFGAFCAGGDIRKIEGDRSARMRLDAAPMSATKFSRKALKQIVWIAVGLWTGFTFVGYFTPIRELAGHVMSWSLGPWETFWIFFYGFATYGNAGYMREQVCKYMCPYARFQSAMFDKDTLIVTYDARRGEPRGARSKKADPKALGLGDCVNCTLCVQVCPTGIDIRNGLQYECISCAACIDVCDEVMDKVGYPRGLIRYSTEHALEEGWGGKQILRHILRPRVLIYSTILAAVTIAMIASLFLRTPFKVDIVRDRATLARIVQGGKIENVYRLQIMNAEEQPQTYTLSVDGLPGLALITDTPEPRVTVDAAQALWVPVRLQAPYDAGQPGSHEIHFLVQSPSGQVREKSVFMVPR